MPMQINQIRNRNCGQIGRSRTRSGTAILDPIDPARGAMHARVFVAFAGIAPVKQIDRAVRTRCVSPKPVAREDDACEPEWRAGTSLPQSSGRGEKCTPGAAPSGRVRAAFARVHSRFVLAGQFAAARACD